MKISSHTVWGGLAVVILVAVYWMTRGAAPTGEKQYFYDVSEKRLFTAARSDFAPVAGIGGEPNDGVEALVVRCPDCAPSELRVVLLTTHTAEFKRKREDEKRNPGQGIPGLTREYISENTLISAPDSINWLKASSPEGGKLVAAWKRKCAKHGEWEKPVMP